MFVYIMTNKPQGTLYTGVTNDLVRRAFEHQTHAVKGFTDKYNLERLVWFEQHDEPGEAIRREKSIKRWNRAWKVDLIETENPEWRDLWSEITGSVVVPVARDPRIKSEDDGEVARCPLPPSSTSGLTRGSLTAPSPPQHNRSSGRARR